MYLEGSGLFSIYQDEEKRPGLPILPPDDDSILKMQKEVFEKIACCNCGLVEPKTGHDKICPHCEGKDWTKAVV